jgi:hypothetical protein
VSFSSDRNSPQKSQNDKQHTKGFLFKPLNGQNEDEVKDYGVNVRQQLREALG